MQTQPVPPIQRWHRCNRAQAMTHNLHTHGMTCSRSSKHGRLMDVGLARPHSQKMLICDLEQQRTCSARTSSPLKPHVTHRRPSWSLTPASIPHDRAGTRAQEDEEEIVGRGDVAEDGAEHQRQTNDEASVGHKDDVDLLDDASKRSSCFVDLQACAHTQTKCKIRAARGYTSGESDMHMLPKSLLSYRLKDKSKASKRSCRSRRQTYEHMPWLKFMNLPHSACQSISLSVRHARAHSGWSEAKGARARQRSGSEQTFAISEHAHVQS